VFVLVVVVVLGFCATTTGFGTSFIAHGIIKTCPISIEEPESQF
jgi:hypothetical protein